MICKELDERAHSDADKWGIAGAKAEQQMAFYLKRAFAGETEIWVFNDLRFETDDGDACQIDHLVMHRSGFILIESKIVTSKVRVHANGAWERLWSNHWQGMSSPIKQAERQASFLRDVFRSDCEKLLGKAFFGKVQKGFGHVPIEVLVAISDHGSIDRRGEVTQVLKADLITDRVWEIVRRHKSARRLFGISQLASDDGVHNSAIKSSQLFAIG